jgi:hypothetical protein
MKDAEGNKKRSFNYFRSWSLKSIMLRKTLIIHDAADDISQTISSSFDEIGEEGRFGELQRALFSLISRNSTIYDPVEDIGEVGEILDQKGDYEERAGRLMGE